MPEYLSPGVYVEEVSFRSKSIEGVSTTTTGFVGPTRYGPLDSGPELVTSLLDFERVYGDRGQLHFKADKQNDPDVVLDNDLWHATRAFFENGGRRLYIQRIYRPTAAGAGKASSDIPEKPAANAPHLTISARYPGAAGGRQVRLTLNTGVSVLSIRTDADGKKHAQVAGLSEYDVVAVTRTDAQGKPTSTDIAVATLGQEWTFTPAGKNPTAFGLSDTALTNPGAAIQPVTVSLTDIPDDPDSPSVVWPNLPLDPRHTRGGAPDSIFDVFAKDPANRADALSLPVIVERTSDLGTGADVQALFKSSTDITVRLKSGDDGLRPTAADYEGGTDTATDVKTGLVALEDIDDISIVAAPGSTRGYEADHSKGLTILGLLISHCERMRYRIAVLDSGENQTLKQVRDLRARLDSKHAALYYPWVRVLDPVTQREISLPPSGFLCGIYARNDIQRAVYKAPANEVVSLAIGFEKTVNAGQQDVLNPEGINCLRYFPGRGYRVWGGRTISSDPEWKYVSLRRYFAYLEHSIDRGTQWAVFEPNGDLLWGNVRRTIYDFLYTEWENGALLGDKPEKAFFVRCDRSTMTQNDLDNGRLVCLIGVAPVRPAEFVIFRIGQWTADRRG